MGLGRALEADHSIASAATLPISPSEWGLWRLGAANQPKLLGQEKEDRSFVNLIL
jgi:hypothetical protein